MIWICFIVFLAACFAAGATGGLFPPGQWYEGLRKPAWTPPNWVFPAAWTTLYLCIAAAGARAAVQPDNALAMAFWALQIALNTLWTPVFFGLRRLRSPGCRPCLEEEVWQEAAGTARSSGSARP